MKSWVNSPGSGGASSDVDAEASSEGAGDVSSALAGEGGSSGAGGGDGGVSGSGGGWAASESLPSSGTSGRRKSWVNSPGVSPESGASVPAELWASNSGGPSGGWGGASGAPEARPASASASGIQASRDWKSRMNFVTTTVRPWDSVISITLPSGARGSRSSRVRRGSRRAASWGRKCAMTTTPVLARA